MLSGAQNTLYIYKPHTKMKKNKRWFPNVYNGTKKRKKIVGSYPEWDLILKRKKKKLLPRT